MLTVMEIGFKLFYVQSDGINFTLSSQAWVEKYWHPINSLGYRDFEWTEENLVGRIRVAVVGDSFVTGYGINYVEDRFANRLGQRLGDDYAVMVIARNGWSTGQELNALKKHPFPPDIVVLSYYLNDILPDGYSHGYSPPEDLLIYPPNWARPLVDNSYLANFVYWRAFRWRVFGNPLNRPEIQGYDAYRRAVYEDPAVWAAHRQRLWEFSDYVQSQGMAFYVVVFPDMLDVAGTRDLASMVAEEFRTMGVPVLEVADLVDEMPTNRRIVSKVDTHPSVEVHRIVADALYDLIFSESMK